MSDSKEDKRRDEVLRRLLKTPHKSHKTLKETRAAKKTKKKGKN